MRLHESIIWSVEEETLSGINIYCDSSKSQEIADFFGENFNKYWDEAKDAVEEEYGDCVEKDENCPSIATVSLADYGVKVVLEPLYLSYQGGDYIESEGYAGKALDKTLTKLLNTYPDVSYEGCIAYTWSDVHCGEAECWQISSSEENPSEDKVYDFIGETLSRELWDPEFWEKMSDNLEDSDIDDFKQVLCNLIDYKKWIPDDAIEQLLDIAGNVDEDIRLELEEAVETIDNGGKIDVNKNEIDESKLPEGYMDALKAVINSEEARKKAEIDEVKAEKDM